jgi:hypothetical protein
VFFISLFFARVLRGCVWCWWRRMFRGDARKGAEIPDILQRNRSQIIFR